MFSIVKRIITNGKLISDNQIVKEFSSLDCCENFLLEEKERVKQICKKKNIEKYTVVDFVVKYGFKLSYQQENGECGRIEFFVEEF